MRSAIAFYKLNATHVNTFITIIGIIVALATGAAAVTIVLIALGLIIGAWAATHYFASTPVPSAYSLRSAEDLTGLAEQALSARLRDDDDQTRLYCESILYSLERIRFRELDSKTRRQLFYALAVAYMRLLIHFVTISNKSAAEDVLRRIHLIQKRINKGFPRDLAVAMPFLNFAEAFNAFRGNDKARAVHLLSFCTQADAPAIVRSRALDILGTIQSRNLDFQNAEASYLISLELKSSLSDVRGQAITNGGIGRLYLDSFEFEKCIPYFTANISISSNVGDVRGVCQSRNHIGMSLISMQRPLEAIDYFNLSLSACRSESVAEHIRLLSSGFSNMGLWLCHSYIGNNEAADRAYREASKNFIGAKAVMAKQLLDVYAKGLSAVDEDDDMLWHDACDSLAKIEDSAICAGFFRVVQAFCLNDAFQDKIISSARSFFDARKISYYRAKFNALLLHRSRIQKAISLPTPLGYIVSSQYMSPENDRITFYAVCEIFLRWMNLILASATPKDWPSILRSIEWRQSMGALLSEIQGRCAVFADSDNTIAAELVKWTNERSVALTSLIKSRNAIVHGRGIAVHDVATFIALRNRWLADIADFGSRFEIRSNHEDRTPADLCPYIIVNKHDGASLRVSPLIYLINDNRQEAIMLAGVEGDDAHYTHLGSEETIKVPIKSLESPAVSSLTQISRVIT